MTLNELIAEARHRNVFRAAGLYAGFAFVVLQLADILLPAFGLDEGNVSVLLLIMALGFPLVLVGSWLIEITPEGLRLTASISPAQRQQLKPGRLVDFAIIVLALGVGFMYLERFYTPDNITPVTADSEVAPVSGAEDLTPVAPAKNSIAVLPFENLSASEENAYFAAGIHEDILNSLSQNPELIVTSRTSTLVYEGSKKAIDVIANDLDVAYVMEGSVRRAGDRVRISVQLIEAATDKHVWSEAYERTLNDIFAIQVEVAENVAAALEVRFGGAPQTPKPNQSVAAYDFFVEARGLVNTLEPQNLQSAIELYEQAVALDQSYTNAWAGLSLALSSLRFAGGATQDTNNRARDTAEQALKLEPDNWLANSAMARYLGSEDVARFSQANGYFDKAIAQNPNAADTLVFYGFTLWWQGRNADALSYFNKAFRRDPLSAEANLARAMALGSVGNAADAQVHVDRALRFAPERPYISWWAGAVYQSILFDQFEAARHFLTAYHQNPRFIQACLWLSAVASHLGDYETTEYWLARARRIDPNHTGVQFRTGDNLAVTENWQGFREHADAWLKRDPDNMVGNVYASGIHSTRAYEAYEVEDMQTFRSEMQGALDDALTYIRDSNNDGESNVQFWNSWMFMAAGTYAGTIQDRELSQRMFSQLAAYQQQLPDPTEIQLVISYAGMGEKDKAIAALNNSFDKGFSEVRHLIIFGVLEDTFGVYDNLKDNVGFIDVVARMRARNEEVLARLRTELPEFFPPVDVVES